MANCHRYLSKFKHSDPYCHEMLNNAQYVHANPVFLPIVFQY